MGRSCTKCDKKHYAKDLCKNHYEKTDEAKAKRNKINQRPKNKTRKNNYNLKYHKKNRDTLLLKMRERYQNLTPEQIESERLRGKQRTANGEYSNYHKNNKDKRNAESKQWHLDNPTYRSEWAKANPIKRLRIEQRYDKKHSKFYNKIQLKSWGDFIKYIFPRCINCGSTKQLESHHILPRAQFPELALAPDNGVTLCKKCHNEITQLLKKFYA
jgi:5-methylcytosine-specific restriction endonuclease McrA|uniref:ORF7 n=1 Tax=Nitrosopumilaceae spindle-shaped virus TaxID=3065433 RepID=A0AAT9J7G4_9VIRU